MSSTTNFIRGAHKKDKESGEREKEKGKKRRQWAQGMKELYKSAYPGDKILREMLTAIHGEYGVELSTQTSGFHVVDELSQLWIRKHESRRFSGLLIIARSEAPISAKEISEMYEEPANVRFAIEAALADCIIGKKEDHQMEGDKTKSRLISVHRPYNKEIPGVVEYWSQGAPMGAKPEHYIGIRYRGAEVGYVKVNGVAMKISPQCNVRKEDFDWKYQTNWAQMPEQLGQKKCDMSRHTDPAQAKGEVTLMTFNMAMGEVTLHKEITHITTPVILVTYGEKEEPILDGTQKDICRHIGHIQMPEGMESVIEQTKEDGDGAAVGKDKRDWFRKTVARIFQQ